jgi:hypothetical protein
LLPSGRLGASPPTPMGLTPVTPSGGGLRVPLARSQQLTAPCFAVSRRPTQSGGPFEGVNPRPALPCTAPLSPTTGTGKWWVPESRLSGSVGIERLTTRASTRLSYSSIWMCSAIVKNRCPERHHGTRSPAMTPREQASSDTGIARFRVPSLAFDTGLPPDL